jgi:hypothetical protein
LTDSCDSVAVRSLRIHTAGSDGNLWFTDVDGPRERYAQGSLVEFRRTGLLRLDLRQLLALHGEYRLRFCA